MAGREEWTFARASPARLHQPPAPPPGDAQCFFLVKTSTCALSSGAPLTVVLSGYFRLSPRKIKRDGRRPAAWTARRPHVLSPLSWLAGPCTFPTLVTEAGRARRPPIWSSGPSGVVGKGGGGDCETRGLGLGLEGHPYLPCPASPGPQVTEATRSCLQTSLPPSPVTPSPTSQPVSSCGDSAGATLRWPCRHTVGLPGHLAGVQQQPVPLHAVNRGEAP